MVLGKYLDIDYFHFFDGSEFLHSANTLDIDHRIEKLKKGKNKVD